MGAQRGGRNGVDRHHGPCVVESVKAASDVYAPVAGEVVAVNTDVTTAPEKVNQDPYASWLFRIKPADAAAAGKLLDARAYEATIGDA